MYNEINYMLTSDASNLWHAMNAREHYNGVSTKVQPKEGEKGARPEAPQMMYATDKIIYWRWLRPIRAGASLWELSAINPAVCFSYKIKAPRLEYP